MDDRTHDEFHPQSDPNVHRGYDAHEPTDVSARAVALVLLAVVTLGVGAHFMLVGLMNHFSREQTANLGGAEPVSTDISGREPRLQPDPTGDLVRFRAAEDAALKSYGWVDGKAKVARIPIERAMTLTVRKGLPVRKTAEGTKTRGERSE